MTIGWSFLAVALFCALIAGFVIGIEQIFGDGSFMTILNQAGRGAPAGMALLGGYLAGYFATLLAIGAVMRIFLMRGVWRKVVASITLPGSA